MLTRTSLIRCCALALIASFLFACEDEPARGALVVRVESDLALPKDLDLVRVDVMRGKQSLLAKERDLYDPQSRLLEFTIPFDGDTTPVEAVAVGYKSGAEALAKHCTTFMQSPAFASGRLDSSSADSRHSGRLSERTTALVQRP